MSLADGPNGYHLLDSFVVFADVHDHIEGEASSSLTLEIDGPFANGLEEGHDNLVMRAAEALRSATGLKAGAALRLHKALPVAAGIGGGSADAAAALRLLNRLWGTGLSALELCEIGESLGADVPACVLSKPLRMTGAGEVLAPFDHPPRLHLVLVNPRVALATSAVFDRRARRSAPFSPPAKTPRLTSAAAFLADLARCHNDLEADASDLAPEIGDVLAALRAAPGCRLARLSGSGATCVGLFGSAAAAAAAAATLARGGDWWLWSGGIVENAKAGPAIL